jgi:hypothetical protein
MAKKYFNDAVAEQVCAADKLGAMVQIGGPVPQCVAEPIMHFMLREYSNVTV